QCDIFLNDMTVSRSHAVVEPTGDGCTITDDSSFNGVWVNNDNVEARELHEGDVVQIGAFCLVYREE
uniref:FHA domain-containing protein n=1 Tax=uncultured Ellagibacter sp. TaxID=2137580 RepID=UPI002633FBB3